MIDSYLANCLWILIPVIVIVLFGNNHYYKEAKRKAKQADPRHRFIHEDK